MRSSQAQTGVYVQVTGQSNDLSSGNGYFWGPTFGVYQDRHSLSLLHVGLDARGSILKNGNTTLGLLDANEYANNNGSATFDGYTVQPNDLLIKYTYFGDVDFNGIVDSSDYNLIDFGFVSGFSGWANGDVDYSGTVDSSDFNLVDFAFVSQNGTLRRAMQYLEGYDRSQNGMSDESLQQVIKHFGEFGNGYAEGFISHVPEPTSLGVIGLAAGALMNRRRRRMAK